MARRTIDSVSNVMWDLRQSLFRSTSCKKVSHRRFVSIICTTISDVSSRSLDKADFTTTERFFSHCEQNATEFCVSYPFFG